MAENSKTLTISHSTLDTCLMALQSVQYSAQHAIRELQNLLVPVPTEPPTPTSDQVTTDAEASE